MKYIKSFKENAGYKGIGDLSTWDIPDGPVNNTSKQRKLPGEILSFDEFGDDDLEIPYQANTADNAHVGDRVPAKVTLVQKIKINKKMKKIRKDDHLNELLP